MRFTTAPKVGRQLLDRREQPPGRPEARRGRKRQDRFGLAAGTWRREAIGEAGAAGRDPTLSLTRTTGLPASIVPGVRPKRSRRAAAARTAALGSRSQGPPPTATRARRGAEAARPLRPSGRQWGPGSDRRSRRRHLSARCRRAAPPRSRRPWSPPRPTGRAALADAVPARRTRQSDLRGVVSGKPVSYIDSLHVILPSVVLMAREGNGVLGLHPGKDLVRAAVGVAALVMHRLRRLHLRVLHDRLSAGGNRAGVLCR